MSIPGSYSGDPTSSAVDEVRFLIGDTNQASFELSDNEILYTLGANPPVNGNYLAASYCAEAIAARFKNLSDKTVGKLHIAHSQRQKNFHDLSIRLRSRAAIAAVPVYAGGLSHAEKLAQYIDPDLAGTAIRIDGMNIVGSVTSQNDGT